MASIIPLFRKGKYAAVLDIKDAFRHIRIADRDQDLFGFEVDGEFYCQTSLPFGWTASPRLWAWVIGAVIQEAARKGVTCMAYVDDVAVIAETAEDCARAVTVLCELFESLGLTLNKAKSQLVPSQLIKYLGYVINLKDGTISLEKTKVCAIRQAAARELCARYADTRRIATLLGMIQGSWLALRWLDAKTP